MAKIKFKVPAQILNSVGNRETFTPGIYELDEKVLSHWFIQGLIASGGAEILEPTIKPEPAKPKQQELPFTAPAAKPVPVKKPEPAAPVIVNLGTKEGVEIEEIKPSASKKKIEVSESIAAPKEAVKAGLRRRKRN
jgi:hypothetical protein